MDNARQVEYQPNDQWDFYEGTFLYKPRRVVDDDLVVYNWPESVIVGPLIYISIHHRAKWWDTHNVPCTRS